MKLLTQLGLYFHTLRYLKLIQVWARIAIHFRSSGLDLRPVPSRRLLLKDWCIPIPREQSQITIDRFRFLNVEHQIASADDWNSQGIEKLWLYNLHYFDDLNARNAINRNPWHLNQVNRWIKENPIGIGVGWESYPVSLRVVNWIKWCLSGYEMTAGVRNSLALQLRFLSRRLEVHLLGNHLFANAKALLFGGLFFDGCEADAWYELGNKIISGQINEQILSDGGHFERSPMYHSLLLEDILDLINLHYAFGKSINPCWHEVIAKMLAWLSAMTHPDGEITFFNDSAIGVAPKGCELVDYAKRLGMQPSFLPSVRSGLLLDSGFARIEVGDILIFADVGSVGPTYLPGHAHAGTLSFELSIYGRRLLVNSGTSEYRNGAERERQRGTAAHNTIRVDKSDSSEVWASFRVARRAQAFGVRYDDNVLTARHDGYVRLKGKPIHSRRWTALQNSLIILDELSGEGSHFIEAFFHIHPYWRPRLIGNNACELVSSDGSDSVIVDLDSSMAWRLEPSTWHPQFGISLPNMLLVGDRHGEFPIQLLTCISWPCKS